MKVSEGTQERSHLCLYSVQAFGYSEIGNKLFNGFVFWSSNQAISSDLVSLLYVRFEAREGLVPLLGDGGQVFLQAFDRS